VEPSVIDPFTLSRLGADSGFLKTAFPRCVFCLIKPETTKELCGGSVFSVLCDVPPMKTVAGSFHLMTYKYLPVIFSNFYFFCVCAVLLPIIMDLF